MKPVDANILSFLIQRGIGYSIFNSLLLNELEKIDSTTSRRIKRKLTPQTIECHKLTADEFFDKIIKNLARQILIREEIRQLIKNSHIVSNTNFKEIRKIMQIHSKESKK